MMTSPYEGSAPALSDSSILLDEAVTSWLTAQLDGAAQCRYARSMKHLKHWQLWNQKVQEGRVGVSQAGASFIAEARTESNSGAG